MRKMDGIDDEEEVLLMSRQTLELLRSIQQVSKQRKKRFSSSLRLQIVASLLAS